MGEHNIKKNYVVVPKYSIQTFLRKEYRFHAIFWVIVFFYPYVKEFASEKGYQKSFSHEIVALVFIMIPTYVMYLWFYPLKRKSKHIITIVLIFIGVTFLYAYVHDFFHDDIPLQDYLWRQLISSLTTYLTFSIVFFALFAVKEQYRKERELKAIIQEKNEAVLRGLKSQVNPHFLFNTLNRIYVNALKKEDKAPDLILKLSDNLRYMLTEGQKDSVLLEQELNYLMDYVNLQKARLYDKIEVDFKVRISDGKKRIAPLLLIAFAENAFKYSSTLKGHYHLIKIYCHQTKEKFSFHCENKFDEKQVQAFNENWINSGIGIRNTKKRLELLYPDSHDLKIENSEGIFKVNLQLQL